MALSLIRFGVSIHRDLRTIPLLFHGSKLGAIGIGVPSPRDPYVQSLFFAYRFKGPHVRAFFGTSGSHGHFAQGLGSQWVGGTCIRDRADAAGSRRLLKAGAPLAARPSKVPRPLRSGPGHAARVDVR